MNEIARFLDAAIHPRWYRAGFLAMVMALSCCRNSPDVPLTPVLTFNQDVQSIILNNCATTGCHDRSGEGRRLVTYAEVMHYVTPDKPYQSKLFNVITRLSFNRMPPKGLMSDEQIKVIYIWVLQGAKEN
jgi:hypothetical protein